MPYIYYGHYTINEKENQAICKGIIKNYGKLQNRNAGRRYRTYQTFIKRNRPKRGN